jgi:hypothetical protein
MSKAALACWTSAVVVGASAGLLWVHAASGPAPAPVMDLQMNLDLPSPVIAAGSTISVGGSISIVGGPSPATFDLAVLDVVDEGEEVAVPDDEINMRLHTVLKRDGTWSFNLPVAAASEDDWGMGRVRATLSAGGKTVQKIFGVVLTGGDFDVAVTPSKDWMYENDTVLTGNRCTITFAASVSNDPAGSASYEYHWQPLPHSKTGKSLVLVSGGGTGDATATYRAPQAPAASADPYIVICEVSGKDEWGGHTGDALGACTVTVRLLGDANGDGRVTVTDFSIWRTQNGQTGVCLSADFNCDGSVTVTDFSIWRANNGKTLP